MSHQEEYNIWVKCQICFLCSIVGYYKNKSDVLFINGPGYIFVHYTNCWLNITNKSSAVFYGSMSTVS